MNENEFKNYYQILGIDKSLIDYVIYDKKKDGKYENKLRNEASKDKKIKEAYEICKNKLCKNYEDRIFKLEKESKLKIGMIERGIENNTDLLKKSKLIGEKESFEESVKYEVKEIKEQFNKRLAEIKEAYEALKTDGARKLYDDQLKEKELEKKNEREFLDETAYTFFEMSEREIELRADTKNNKIIKEAYNKKVEKYTKVLNDISLNPEQRKRAEDILKKTKEYYEKINTKEKRDTYKKELDLKEEIERKKINKEKYSKIDQLDFKMIGTVKEGKNKGRKLVAKTENRNPQVVDLNDSRKIKISKTGEIIFKNSVLLCNSVNEYLISRIINGKEKKDKIYTNLSLPSLTEDNLDYYNCVVNEMLSEDVIEVVTKYNGGYIGMIEKDEASGGYKATIRDKSLNTEEQEIFAAVMINLENEKNKENKKQEDNSLEL